MYLHLFYAYLTQVTYLPYTSYAYLILVLRLLSDRKLIQICDNHLSSLSHVINLSTRYYVSPLFSSFRFDRNRANRIDKMTRLQDFIQVEWFLHLFTTTGIKWIFIPPSSLYQLKSIKSKLAVIIPLLLSNTRTVSRQFQGMCWSIFS